MNPIGGYFELECGHFPQYHKNGYLLNSCRSALRLAIRTFDCRKIHLPFYTCPIVWDAAKKENCECIGYEIGMDFMPTVDFPEDDFVLYTNYFGICAAQVTKMTRSYPNLIVDNAQAFYMPMQGISSIYSPRKFFGVPDGGIFLSPKAPILPKERSISWQRCTHLLKRWDLGATAGYEDFQRDDAVLSNEAPLRMSYLTQSMMGSIDYEGTKKQRLSNFHHLHAHLKNKNHLDIQLFDEDVPMVYPFLCDDTSLRQKLIAEKIFVAKYWPSAECGCFENLLALPIDQRYDSMDMERILQCLSL